MKKRDPYMHPRRKKEAGYWPLYVLTIVVIVAVCFCSYVDHLTYMGR